MVIFLFNPQTLKGGAIAGKAGAAGAKFYQLQSGNKGPFDYDWDVSWTQMGYHQYVPRLQLIDKGYSQITPNLNLADVKVRAAMSPYLSSIKAYTTDSKGEARKALPGGAFPARAVPVPADLSPTRHAAPASCPARATCGGNGGASRSSDTACALSRVIAAAPSPRRAARSVRDCAAIR